jgi:hypothetical protein
MWDIMEAVKIMGMRRFLDDLRTRPLTKVGISPLFSAKLNPRRLTITVPKGLKPEKFLTMSPIMLLNPWADKRFKGRRTSPLIGFITESSSVWARDEVTMRMMVRKKNKKTGWGR